MLCLIHRINANLFLFTSDRSFSSASKVDSKRNLSTWLNLQHFQAILNVSTALTRVEIAALCSSTFNVRLFIRYLKFSKMLKKSCRTIWNFAESGVDFSQDLTEVRGLDGIREINRMLRQNWKCQKCFRKVANDGRHLLKIWRKIHLKISSNS